MWIELHDTAREHPKILKLARDLGIKPVEALGHVCSLWTWVLRMAPDGCLESFDTEDIEIGAQWDGKQGKFLDKAIYRKLIDDNDDSLSVHDWMDFAGSLKAAGRARAARKRKREEESQRVRHGNARVRTRTVSTLTDQTRPDQNDQTKPLAQHPTGVTPEISPEFIRIPLGRGGTHHAVTEEDIVEYEQNFPGVDIRQTLRAIRQWNLDRPKNRKTKSGIRKHIGTWLAKEQNKGQQGPRISAHLSPAQINRIEVDRYMQQVEEDCDEERGKTTVFEGAPGGTRRLPKRAGDGRESGVILATPEVVPVSSRHDRTGQGNEREP